MKAIDVSKLEPVWVREQRAQLADDLARFIRRCPAVEIRAGRLRLKAAGAARIDGTRPRINDRPSGRIRG
jgi:hypothetical protein